MREDTGTIIRMCGVEPESIVDGPGFRYVVFVQGCPHHCEGCHNPESHAFDGGYDLSVGELYDEIKKNPFLGGVTFSGGEPFCQAKELLALAKMLKSDGINLMCFTGFTLDELEAKNCKDESVKELLGLIDILVDGKFVLGERNLTLLYRGSENQRVIDMNKTREQGEVVLWKSEFEIEF